MAFGDSLSDQIDLIKKYRASFKIMCCDKAFGYLMDHEIFPDYCMIADASVSDEWIKGHNTFETTLISNIAANPAWSSNWKGRRVFYTNWDNIQSGIKLGKAGNCYETIPASSNVSNSQVVMAAQVLNPKAQLLIGYDYSWNTDGKYYASEDTDKRHYMHHEDVITFDGKLAMTSTNLLFSCYWLTQYLQKFENTVVVNCSGRGILNLEKRMSLRKGIFNYTLN